MKRRRWVRFGAMIALTGVALAAIVAGPITSAVGFFSPPLTLDVQIQSPAKLVARGAAVDVTLKVVCTSERADLFVQVSERVGSAIAQGSAFKEITCEGDLQDVTITVFANNKAFKRGTAVVQAEIFGCVRFCASERDTAEIAVVRS